MLVIARFCSYRKGLEEGSKTMRRIELRLPEDNVLFSYPAGTRSAMAIDLLNIGQTLSDITTQLSNMNQRISAIEQKISGIEGKISSPGYTSPIREDLVNTQVSNKEKIARSLIEGFGLFE